jgi:hypothetical protein
MKSEILFVLPSFVLGIVLFVLAFFVGEDVIVVGAFVFLGLIVFFEGLSSLLYLMSHRAHSYFENNQ